MKSTQSRVLIPVVDLIRHYSNRSDLLDDLDRAVRRLERAAKEPAPARQSVSSSGRVNRVWAVRDRLNEDDIRGIVQGFNAGVSKIRLARQYGISDSSVKRILRQRAADWVVQREVEPRQSFDPA